MQPLTSTDVQTALDTQNAEIQVRHFEQSTATSAEAAAAIQTELGSIVKSIVFWVDTQPIVALMSGDQKVDDKKLAAHYNVGRKKIRIATTDECVAIVGYPPGSVPPLGHRTPNLPILIDQTLSRFDQLYAAAGAPNAIFPVTLAKLTELTGGQPMDLAKA